MKGVPYDVLGVGADGQKIRMKPGREYMFNQAPVTEYPLLENDEMFQRGGPTSTDSLNLYNSQLALNRFYDNEVRAGRLSQPSVSITSWLKENDPYLKQQLQQAKKENLNYYRKQINDRTAHTFGGLYDQLYKKYYGLSPQQVSKLEYQGLGYSKAGNDHQMYYRDLITPDQNLASPFAMLDDRINPQYELNYHPVGTEPGNLVTIYGYDPLAVKPYNMRTKDEKIQWEKKYGKYIPPKPKPKPIPKPKPKTSTTTTKKTVEPPITQQVIETPVQPTQTVKPSYTSGDIGGDPVYGPGNSLIGFMNKGKFSTYEHNALNKADKELLQNQNALHDYVGRKYGKEYVKFEYGGPLKRFHQGKMTGPGIFENGGNTRKNPYIYNEGFLSHPKDKKIRIRLK